MMAHLRRSQQRRRLVALGVVAIASVVVVIASVVGTSVATGATRALRSTAPLRAPLWQGDRMPARDDGQALVAFLPPARDAAERAARQALGAGASWRASAVLVPSLAPSASPSTAVRGVAAAAAAAREEWGTVETLLRGVQDTGMAGFASLLRARAALARGAIAGPAAAREAALRLALVQARHAAEVSSSREERGVRLAVAARALDRLVMLAEDVGSAASGGASAGGGSGGGSGAAVGRTSGGGAARGDRQRSDVAAALADSARVAYVAAGELLTPIADWLALRAAEVTRDPARRGAGLAGVRLAAARERVSISEATARERAGDLVGAAVGYRGAGRAVQAFALRLEEAARRRDSDARVALRDSLVRFVAARSGTSEARQAVALLDAWFAATLSPGDELTIARSAAVSGPASRAVLGFGRVFNGGAASGTVRDRYSYATLLGRTGRVRDAIGELTRVRDAGGVLAGDAAYERGRLLLRVGSTGAAEARHALRDVVATFGSDSGVTGGGRASAAANAAANALALLADLAVDDGRDAEARRLLLELARRYPASGRAAAARFDAALIAFAEGDSRVALSELDAIRGATLTDESRDVHVAATYWAGRAASAAGDARLARARWTEVATQTPQSYYAELARRRIGVEEWRPAVSAVPVPADRVVDEAVQRIALLQRIGFDAEAGWERDWLVRWATAPTASTASTASSVPTASSARSAAGRASPSSERDADRAFTDRTLAVARGLRDAGATSSAMRLAGRLVAATVAPVESGTQSMAPRLAYELAYPWPWESFIRDAARDQQLDPALVAAVIRQESNFTPTAVSSAGAVGLMQLMPPVARALWSSLGDRRGGVGWSASLLREPDVSVALGTRHLASSIAQYPDVAYALAAYNAGGTPVARWRRRLGASDPELFVERIPYGETRDYVRIVTRNAAMYRALYGR